MNLYIFYEAAEAVKKDFGSIDILVHSLANGPEVLSLPIFYLFACIHTHGVMLNFHVTPLLKIHLILC
jgi:hypothetical protein